MQVSSPSAISPPLTSLLAVMRKSVLISGNYIAVVRPSNCAAHTAELIARRYESAAMPPNVDGVVAFPRGEGCAHAMEPDTRQKPGAGRPERGILRLS